MYLTTIKCVFNALNKLNFWHFEINNEFNWVVFLFLKKKTVCLATDLSTDV